MTFLLRGLEQFARMVAEWCERAIERREGAGDFGKQFSRMLRTKVRIKVRT